MRTIFIFILSFFCLFANAQNIVTVGGGRIDTATLNTSVRAAVAATAFDVDGMTGAEGRILVNDSLNALRPIINEKAKPSDITNSINSLTTTGSFANTYSEILLNHTFDGNLDNWTAGSGWSYASGGAAHSSGTATLTQTVSLTGATYYILSIYSSARTVGSFTAQLGSLSTYTVPWSDEGFTYQTKHVSYLTASSGNHTLTITPTTDYNGVIDSISLKRVYLNSAQGALSIRDANGDFLASAYGDSALFNFGIGGLALSNNVKGYRNFGLGPNALAKLITGYKNTAIGNNSQTLNYGGYKNTSVGTNSLVNLTLGFHNTAVGFDAVGLTSTGYQNDGFGIDALYSNTTGYFNVGMGAFTLHDIPSGNRNTAVGASAGTNSGNLTLASYCTWVGANARSTANSVSNAIGIGYDVQTTKSNQAIFGNSSITETILRGTILNGTDTLAAKSFVRNGLNLKANLISPVFTTPNIGNATGSISGNAGTVTGFVPTGGQLILAGADNLTLTTTNTTNVTLPVSGTLATTQAIHDSIVNAGLGVGYSESEIKAFSGEVFNDSIIARMASAVVGVLFTQFRDSIAALRAENAAQQETIDALSSQLSGVDLVPPHPVSAVINNAAPTTLLLTLDKNDIHQDSIPDHETFTITRDATPEFPTNVTISDSIVTLTLANPAVYGEVFLLYHTRAYPGMIQDSSHNKMANIVGMAVTNNMEEANLTDPPAFLSTDTYTEGWYISDVANLTIVNTDHISGWTDMSGKTHPLAQTADAARPHWSASDVTFGGTDSYLNNTTVAFAQPATVYFVVNVTTYGDGNHPLGLGDFDAPYLRLTGDQAQLRLYTAGGALTLTTGMVYNDLILITCVINGANSSIQINDGTPVTGTLDATAITGLMVSANDADSSPQIVKELIVRHTADDGTEQAAVKAYLNAVWTIY